MSPEAAHLCEVLRAIAADIGEIRELTNGPNSFRLDEDERADLNNAVGHIEAAADMAALGRFDAAYDALVDAKCWATSAADDDEIETAMTLLWQWSELRAAQ